MIPQETIENIKGVSRIEEVVGGFITLKKVGRDYEANCPFHSESTPSFRIHSSENRYKCFGCGKSGDSIDFIMEYSNNTYIEAIKFLASKYNVLIPENGKEKEYVRPKWTNNTNLSDSATKWFKGRGISQKTLINNKITEGKTFMPQIGKETNTVHFNYFRGEQLINTKYRDSKKNQKFVSGAELIFYNYNVLDSPEIIITEGEIDCLSFIEAGYENTVSVPNGASVTPNSKLEYITTAWDKLEKIKTFYIATDNDVNGIKLRNELIRRLGNSKCRIIDFNDCKDANEYLIKHGIIKLSELIVKAPLLPISGVIRISDMKESIESLYTNGLEKGKITGIPEFDDLISFVEGYISTFTGVPSHGKSAFLDFILVLLMLRYNWRFAIFSPENFPLELHYSSLAEKLIGKRFSGQNKMNREEKDMAEKYIGERAMFIRPENEQFTIENILETAKNLVLREGIKGLIIDPWNRLEHHIPKGISETNYVSIVLDKISTFKQKYGVHVFLVAHPTKLDKLPNGLFAVPNLYNISGSANFYNKTDIGITVYRDFIKNDVTIYVQKVKFRHWGKIGSVTFKYDEVNGRYYINEPDYSNWLLKETKPTYEDLERKFLKEPVKPHETISDKEPINIMPF